MMASRGMALKWKNQARTMNNCNIRLAATRDNVTMMEHHWPPLDEVCLNAIIAGVSTKLMSNPSVSGIMHHKPALQKWQQQRQLFDTLMGKLLVKLLIYV